METLFQNEQAYAALVPVVIGASIILVLAVIGTSIAGTFIASFWFKHLRLEKELDLKRELVERGMSATEICEILNAGSRQRFDCRDGRHDKKFKREFLRRHACDHQSEN